MNIDRRDFLKLTGLGTAVLVLGFREVKADAGNGRYANSEFSVKGEKI
jgi:hypothetical protein